MIKTIDELLKEVGRYNKSLKEHKIIRNAYELADNLHGNQMRESGDKYIVHPLNVAYTLATLNADTDTIIAGLLHDAAEDTDITIEEISEMFGKDVGKLVDGVTKIKHIRVENDLNNKSTDIDEMALNIEKIVNSMNDDVRVMIIKLADRLHNMRTLEFKKKKEKRLRKCKETLYFFAPLAYNLGLYNMKCELEDYALKFIDEEGYKKVTEMRKKLYKREEKILLEMKKNLEEKLRKERILSKEPIKILVKHPYRIYRKLNKGKEIEDLTNLFCLEINVKSKKDCYTALSVIHNEYQYIGRKFRDYISVGKTNGYKSLHTAVFTDKDIKVHIKIQTNEMAQRNNTGIASRWNKNKESKITMQEVYHGTEFYKSLKKIITTYKTSDELIERINLLFKPGIYIVVNQTFYRVPPKAKVGDLPRLIPNIFDGAVKITVDGKDVSLNEELKSRQSIRPIFE